MIMGDIQALDIQIPREIVQYWGWFLVFGIALLLLGIAALVRSVAATVGTMLFFGWLLIIASAIEVVQAVMVGHWVGFFQHLLAVILFGVIGVMLIARPLISAEALTVVMAVFFLIGRLFQLIASFAVALPGWGWQAADGIIMLVLGGLILAQWPASGLWGGAAGGRPYDLDGVRRRDVVVGLQIASGVARKVVQILDFIPRVALDKSPAHASSRLLYLGTSSPSNRSQNICASSGLAKQNTT